MNRNQEQRHLGESNRTIWKWNEENIEKFGVKQSFAGFFEIIYHRNTEILSIRIEFYAKWRDTLIVCSYVI